MLDFARTIWAEARGEGYQGMKGVANSIMNRANIASDYVDAHGHNHPLYGDGTADSACRVPWQFSCWNNNDPNLPLLKTVTSSDAIFSQCLKMASDAENGLLDDITNGATHYFDRRMPRQPDWAEGKNPTAIINHHVFYNLGEG